MKRPLVAALLALACIGATALALPGADSAGAQEATTLRIATLAPRGSQWDRAFRAWSNTLSQQTGGRLRLQFHTGGVQGDEREILRKMEEGQLDGASITTNGFGEAVRPVLVLSAPGLMREYAQMDRVRRELDGEMHREFERAGYRLMGWNEFGRARFFSKRAITRPSDLRQTRPWARPDDPVVSQFYTTVGVGPQRLGVNQLLPSLTSGRIDAFPSPALAALSLQWFQHVTHVTQQASSVVVGVTVIKKERFDALPEDLQAALTETGTRAHAALLRSIRRADDQAYTTITGRGVRPVDISAHQAEWDRVGRQTRQALTGRVYSREMLERVERLAAGR